MPSKWISLKTFEREYIDFKNEESILNRVIALGASGELEVKAGFWIKTHYKEIRNVSVTTCLGEIHDLTHEEKEYIRKISKSVSGALQHIRIGVSYLTIYRTRGSILMLFDVSERHPLEHVEILPSFWEDAHIDLEGGSIVFMDRTNYQRFVASKTCFNRTDIERAFGTHVPSAVQAIAGRPAEFYTDKKLQVELEEYFKKHRAEKNLIKQFEYARELCRKRGAPVSGDMAYQVERKLRKRLMRSLKDNDFI